MSTRFAKAEATRLTCATLAAIVLIAASARAQMPDARQMSGIPRPDPQLATGTVTVRVARGSFANPVVSLTVDLTGGSSPRQATTNAEGRAEFTGIAPGTRVKASAVVAGEKLESQEFPMPASGGVRLALVAADPSGAPATAAPAAPRPAVPAQPGDVVLGEDSRFVFEMGEDGLNVFYVLQVRNGASSPVQPAKPLVFELPADARGAGLLDGSSPQAKISGRRVEISGPFQPGDTIVQVGYTFPFGDANITIEQPVPVRLMHVAVVAEKAGEMQLSSPQVRDQQTMPANGKMYIAGRGGAVDANQILSVHVHRDAPSQHVAARRRARAGVPDSRRRRLVDDAWRWQAGRRRGVAGGSSKPGATVCSTISPPWKAPSGRRPSVPKSSPGAGASW